MVDGLPGPVVRHRLERDVGPVQQTGGGLGRHPLVVGKIADRLHPHLRGHLLGHRGPSKKVRRHLGGHLVIGRQAVDRGPATAHMLRGACYGIGTGVIGLIFVLLQRVL